MYNNYLRITDSKNGKGLFTTVDIPANIPIIECTGDLFTKANLPTSEYILQVGEDAFIGPSGTLDDYINHHCEPNCYFHIIGNRAILYSLFLIKAGSELTIDYSLNSTDTKEGWQMSCNCGSHACRRTISGFQYLSDDLQQKSIKQGIVPLFIVRKDK